MSGGDRRRGSQPRQFADEKPPEMSFEIRRAEGADGEALAREQVAAIREVLAWIARRRSGTGPGPDA